MEGKNSEMNKRQRQVVNVRRRGMTARVVRRLALLRALVVKFCRSLLVAAGGFVRVPTCICTTRRAFSTLETRATIEIFMYMIFLVKMFSA